MDLQRHTAFFAFFNKYPDAERHESHHENGRYSTFAVGLFNGVVNEAYLSVNKADGSLSEEWKISDDELAQALGKNRIDYADALSALMRLSVVRAGSPAKSV